MTGGGPECKGLFYWDVTQTIFEERPANTKTALVRWITKEVLFVWNQIVGILPQIG